MGSEGPLRGQSGKVAEGAFKVSVDVFRFFPALFFLPDSKLS
jgi:hypothetical protein